MTSTGASLPCRSSTTRPRPRQHARDLRRPDRLRHQRRDRRVQGDRPPRTSSPSPPATKGAEVLAGIGITPALLTDPVVETYFAVDGAPTDDLSKFAYSTHEVHPENPTSSKTAAIQGILNDMHTAIMSGSTPVDQAIKEAQDRVANEVGLD